jgi:hypothetical protein
MSFDISALVTALGDEAIAKCGEPLGLDKDQSVRAARALAAHAGLGDQQMLAAVAADTGLDEEVIAAMLKRLGEIAAEKLMSETPVGAAVDSAKQQAMAAMGDAGAAAMRNAGGFLGNLFGRK